MAVLTDTQDYEQIPQTDRDQLMVHVFFYLNGLDGTVGDLMCLPKSQNAVMERGAFSNLWQDHELPGSLTFGSVCVCLNIYDSTGKGFLSLKVPTYLLFLRAMLQRSRKTGNITKIEN